MLARSSVRQLGPPLIGDALVASGAMRQARPMVARPSGIELQSWDVTAAMRTGGPCPAVSEANGQPLPGGLGDRLYLRCADHRHFPVASEQDRSGSRTGRDIRNRHPLGSGSFRRSMRRPAKLLVSEIEFHFRVRQRLGEMFFLHRDLAAIVGRHGVPVDHVREIFGAIDPAIE